MDAQEEKLRIRKLFSARRAALMACCREALEAGIAEHVAALPAWREARLVLGYAAFRSEPGVGALLERALREGKDVALPRCAAPGRLAWHRVAQGGDPHGLLAPGAYGILEPPDDAATLVGAAELAAADVLALVPGLAFDLRGARLGYGGGYYDRFLPTFGGLAVGVCPDELLVDDLVALGALEPHDCRVHIVATEHRAEKARGKATAGKARRRGPMRLADMHCHLDFARDPAVWAAAAEKTGAAAFSCTVDPRAFEPIRAALADCPQVRVGAGLHPWWLADGTCGPAEVDLACELAQVTPFVGEVGLDFAPRREGTFDAQLAAFDRICGACAQDGDGKVVSIHAVRSATAVLDVLERHGLAASSACILHWFSGSGDELARAVRLGCWFSVGTRMLATKRGRAYARQIPPGRLLLETDLPDGSDDASPAASWLDDLAAAHANVAGLLGDEAAQKACKNGRALLGLN